MSKEEVKSITKDNNSEELESATPSEDISMENQNDSEENNEEQEVNIATGTIADSLESIDELIGHGVQMIAFLNDTGILYDAVESVVKAIRR